MVSFFEALSIYPLEQVRGLNLLHSASIDKLLNGQGMSADSYLINTIMPLVQKINEKRSGLLRVVAIDGFTEMSNFSVASAGIVRVRVVETLKRFWKGIRNLER